MAVDTDYVFDTAEGPRSLSELFDGRAQLIVYHFMFGPDWQEGCPSCSFWADSFNGIDVHLAHPPSRRIRSRLPPRAQRGQPDRTRWTHRWPLILSAAGIVNHLVDSGPAASYC